MPPAQISIDVYTFWIMLFENKLFVNSYIDKVSWSVLNKSQDNSPSKILHTFNATEKLMY